VRHDLEPCLLRGQGIPPYGGIIQSRTLWVRMIYYCSHMSMDIYQNGRYMDVFSAYLLKRKGIPSSG